MAHKWEHPIEWLDEKIDRLAEAIAERQDPEDLAALVSLTRECAQKLDGDQIQDLFQSEMDVDGYFIDSMPRPEDDDIDDEPTDEEG